MRDVLAAISAIRVGAGTLNIHDRACGFGRVTLNVHWMSYQDLLWVFRLSGCKSNSRRREERQWWRQAWQWFQKEPVPSEGTPGLWPGRLGRRSRPGPTAGDAA